MTKPLHRIALAVAAAYLFTVTLVVFWPTPVDRQGAGTLRQMLALLHQHGMPAFINYNLVEFSANIAMFIPMGFIAVAFFKKSWTVILVATLGSCLIEASQALFLPDRFASGLDVLANTMGAGLGAVELAQALFLPQRFPSWSDIVANTSGAFFGALLVLFVWSLRRRRALRMANHPA